MGDSGHINETVETIDMLIVSAIEQLKKSQKRSDEHAILIYLQKKGSSMNQQTLSLSIASFIKNGIILNKPSSGKNCCSVKPNMGTEQISATPKSFIMEQLYVMKKCVEDFRSENVTSNRVKLSCTSY